MRFLVDTSALTRLLRQQADSDWDRLEDRGLLSVCEPVLAEKPPGCVSRRAGFAFRGWVALHHGGRRPWVAGGRRGLPHSADGRRTAS